VEGGGRPVQDGNDQGGVGEALVQDEGRCGGNEEDSVQNEGNYESGMRGREASTD
jgi:hypothetical protein